MVRKNRFWLLLLLVSGFGYQSVLCAEGQTIQVEPGKPRAPVFLLKDLDDNIHQLNQYKGKVVAVNFWATWCPPCRKELPSMQRTYEALKDDDFIIVAVNVGEDWETVAPFLEGFGIKFPVLLDKDSSVLGQWRVLGLPTTFILDKEGRITHRINGGRDWDAPEFRKKLSSIVRGAK